MTFIQNTELFTRVLYREPNNLRVLFRERNNLHVFFYIAGNYLQVFYTEHAVTYTCFTHTTPKFPRVSYRKRSNFQVFYTEHAII